MFKFPSLLGYKMSGTFPRDFCHSFPKAKLLIFSKHLAISRDAILQKCLTKIELNSKKGGLKITTTANNNKNPLDY